MASPLLLARNYKFDVFASFHGPDVRKTLLSHMREQFDRNGITMFNDQGIERGAIIAPSLMEAIKDSKILIVLLSEKYASSSWCLDELVEILECKKAMGQIVMTVFYGVDPSHVRKQAGNFGIAFNETCKSKTVEERQKWSKALNDVGHIAGEDFYRWDNEANMIKKIARDVSDKLNATPSRDFDGMVGLEDHLREMESLLDLDNDEVKIVAITGPAGIGKTTIARALHSRLSNRFQLSCFVDNLRANNHSGFDEYGLMLQLQEQFLLKILNLNDIRICNLGVIKERLQDKRVLIILDDVNNLKQLQALANEPMWFGPGSRIVVTTENMELLQQHGINNMYHVGFPSDEQALEILCRYAFSRQSYPHNGFRGLAFRVTELCDKLPLGLRVVGSSLRGKREDEWEDVVRRLETILDGEIEDVLRVGYEALDENEKTLFLHIAIFFHYHDGDLVKAMFADSDVDVKCGLKILVNRSLIEVSSTYEGRIVMHKLLEQMARQTIRKQEHSKHQILLDAHEICHVLENETVSRAVSGISFDISGIDELSVGKKAFKKMPNLRFLKVYKSKKDDGNDRMDIPEGMEFPRRLRLLRWDAYPSKCLPPTFDPEYLVKLDMRHSKLEYLWQGTQKLTNLKEINLRESYQLKELPDLSNATNLETLYLTDCESLIEIPSSCSHLQKLQTLNMNGCRNLQVIPADLNLASLEFVKMLGCPKLRNFPIMSTHMTFLCISEAEFEDVPASISLCSRLEYLSLNHNIKLSRLTHFPASLMDLHLNYSDIVSLPDCIKALHQLQRLDVSGCSRLASLPELPSSLLYLKAHDCDIERLPDGIKALHQLRDLDVSGCSRLTSLPELPTSLEKIKANDSGIEMLPDCIKALHQLRDLDVSGCSRLASLPELPTSLEKIKANDSGIEMLPDGIKALHQLLDLDVSGCRRLASLPELPSSLFFLYARYSGIEMLPDCIKALHQLLSLDVSGCSRLASLPELPSSLLYLKAHDCGIERLPDCIKALHQLRDLDVSDCSRLASLSEHGIKALHQLKELDVSGCSRLASLPELPSSLEALNANDCDIERLPDCIKALPQLECLSIAGCTRLTSLPELPNSLGYLIVNDCDIERLPDCIKALHQLETLGVSGCRRLTSLPELPSSLKFLRANDCESLETVFFPFNTLCHFRNCFKLGKQARKAIIQQSIISSLGEAILPGRKVPVEFKHRALGNSLTVPLNGEPLPPFTYFVVCLVVSTNQIETGEDRGVISCRIVKDDYVDEEKVRVFLTRDSFQKEHITITNLKPKSLQNPDPPQVSRKIVFEFSSEDNEYNIFECGVQIRTKESYGSVTSKRYESEPSQALEDQVSENDDDDDDWSYDEFETNEASQDHLKSELTDQLIHDSDEQENLQSGNHTGCWSWLILCFHLPDIARKIGNLVSGTRPGFGREAGGL